MNKLIRNFSQPRMQTQMPVQNTNTNTNTNTQSVTKESYTLTISSATAKDIKKFTKEVNNHINKNKLPFPLKRYNYTDNQIKEMFIALQQYVPTILLDSDMSAHNVLVIWEIYTKQTSPYLKRYGTIKDSIQDAYNKINILPDMFNELPRIKSTGYSEEYSPYSYWTIEELRDRWLPTLFTRVTQNASATTNNNSITITHEDFREALAGYTHTTKVKNAIIEPRQSRCTTIKGLFLHAKTMLHSEYTDLRILDVPSAYGDRMITALACNVQQYMAIDPFPDLEYGYKTILGDLAKPGHQITYSITPAEDTFISNNNFNVAIMSPPPHTSERYGYDKDSQHGQSFITYPQFEDWLINFIFKTITKLYNHLDPNNGLFYLTILDRVGSQPIKYTELTLTYSSLIGFTYQHILFWEGDKKGTETPFWVFVRRPTASSQISQIAASVSIGGGGGGNGNSELVEKFRNIHGDIFDRIKKQIFAANNLIPTTVSTHIIENNPVPYKIKTTVHQHSNTYPTAELLRYYLMKGIVESIYNTLSLNSVNVDKKKLSTFMGRWVMMQSINDSISIDPMFPYNGTYHSQLVDNITELVNKSTDSTSATTTTTTATILDILTTKEYILDDVRTIGITNLFNEAIVQQEFNENKLYHTTYIMNLRQSQKGIITINITLNNQGSSDLLAIVQKYIPSMTLTRLTDEIYNLCQIHEIQYKLLESKYEPITPRTRIEIDVFNCIVRYHALNAMGHQYTREEQRYIDYNKKYGMDFELFGAPFNVHASHHMSVFYDVDRPFGSIGSFFASDLISGIYLANPVTDNYFATTTIKRIITQLASPSTKLTFLVGPDVWTDEDGWIQTIQTSHELIAQYKQRGSKEYIKQILNTPYVRDMFIQKDYKPLDPIKGQLSEIRKDRIPLVIVLSNISG